ncbi:MAG TPA: bifunctional diaminohydroxyphosphoribosylaminopyrimidine deaminase/5-amino-6-(5-phosphoribosylamino)uracil reductase RibD [Candidatus Acidoferrales bacterium]|nr:bifunctional diaminohydroxyphosphoribosylaminopyrimidine deaminase/5-amino-6-(5-phosphoribosylamino)uracil reductase RibD [Candidatus Acidoferrales bacterium]
MAVGTTIRARTDEEWMGLALDLAAQGEGLTSPNPMVGAVVVRDGEEVARAYHTFDGVKHAEALALEQAGSAARGATLYTNLEPCSHRGRTPPCVEAIIAAGIRRVVAAMPDPNPQVNGRGFERLRAAGIDVAVGAGEDEARRLNDSFAGWIRTGRPFVTLKSALSLDAKIAPASAAGHEWITSEESRAHVHHLRHGADALLTGIGTVLADDPLLTDRSGLPRRRPLVRVILDAGLRLPLDSQLVKTAQKDVLVFTGEDVWMGKRRELESRGVEIIELKESGGRLSLIAVLKKLAERQITTVLLEAGSHLNTSALDSGLVDKLWLFYSPKLLGPDAVPFLSSTGHRTPVTGLSDIRFHRFGPDFAIEGYLHDVYRDH